MAALAFFFVLALSLRIWLPYEQVFTGDWIKFTSFDAYYHMRIVDNLVHNFPRLMDFDPYLLYPSGVAIDNVHFFDWLLASIIWVVGLGSPSQQTIDAVAVYFPAVLGSLTVVPVYFIGKELFGRWAGVISASLVAVLPSEFLGRSILGFTDHHVAETLLSTVTMLFLIVALRTAKQGGLAFHHVRTGGWTAIVKPTIYSALAGLFLGIYLLTWQGALLFVFIICVYLAIQAVMHHLRRESTDYLCLVGIIVFLVALIVFLPASPGRLYLSALAIALCMPVVLSGVSRLLVSREARPIYYPLALSGFGLGALGIFAMVSPSLLSSMLSKFGIFAPSGAYLTVLEMQPLLLPQGNFTLALAWGNFTTGFFLGLIALGMLTYLVIKTGDPAKTLFVVWGLIILAATLGQRRFAYYLVVNIALLSGYISVVLFFAIRFVTTYLAGEPARYPSWQTIGSPVTSELTTPRPPRATIRREKRKAKHKKRREEPIRTPGGGVATAFAVLIIFFLVLFPNIRPAVVTAQQARFAPSNAWYGCLSWLMENTPDPFGDSNFYYELHEPASSPKPAYGVLAWWDYGYWITRVAHRVPNANPSQAGAGEAAYFFLSQDEETANEIIQALGSRYVIIDYETTTTKFYALARWAGRSPSDYFDVYYVRRGGKNEPTHLFYPEYYRAISTRLYNFDGKAVTPKSPLVISYRQRAGQGGESYKEVVESKPFASYEEALAFITSQKSANYRLVGTHPYVSPVPLEAVKNYQLIHKSEALTMQSGTGMIPSVKIFEYIGAE